MIAATNRPRFFYGWYIVGLAFLGNCFGVGITTYAFGVFLKPMAAELSWTRAMITGALSISTIVSGVSSPFIGRVVDRYGGRPPMVFGGLAAGLGFMSISQVHELWQFYLLWGLVVGAGTLCIGSVVVNTAVANWFFRKRGRALAFGAMGTSFGGMILTPLSQTLISAGGWRFAWVVLGIIVWVGIIVPAAVFMRRRPEDLGLRPDGLESATVNSDGKLPNLAPVEEPTWTVREAVRTPTLWLLMVAFELASMGSMVIMIHLVAYLTDVGFTQTEATTAMTIFAATMLVTKLGWGLVAERINPRTCIMLAFVWSAAGMWALTASQSVTTVYLSAVFYGLGMAAFLPLTPLAWATYYGRVFLGSIQGLIAPFGIITRAGGPFFAAWIFDATHSYTIALTAAAILTFLSAGIVFIARPPKQAAALPLPALERERGA